MKSKLKLGGVFHMATDWEPYAEHMLEVMSSPDGYKISLKATTTYRVRIHVR